MLDQVFSLLDSTGTLVGVIGAFAFFMGAAGRWSDSRAKALVTGVCAAVVLALFVGRSWAEDELRNCDAIRERFSLGPTAEGRAELTECREQNSETTLAHELAFFTLLAAGGAVGYLRSSYHRGMSLDHALDIAQEIGAAIVENERVPYTLKQCREAEAVLSQLPLNAEYLSALKVGIMIVRVTGR